MIFARRAILAVLSLATFALGNNSVPAPDSLVQPRLDQLSLSPDFKITDKPTTRTYDWTVSAKEGAPDGFYRTMLVVNGACLNIYIIILIYYSTKLPLALK